MIPHNRLGRDMMRRLKVYPGDAHPHQAQVQESKVRDIQEGTIKKGA